MISIEYSAYFLHYCRVAAAPNFNAPPVVAIMPPHAQTCRCRDIAGRACQCNGEGLSTISLALPVHFHGHLVTDAPITMVMAASSKWQKRIVTRGVIWPRWEQRLLIA